MENIEELQQNERTEEAKGSVVDLTVGSPTKKIIMFALPRLAGNVFQLFYSWTDAIILGNVKGEALQFGALSASLPVVNLLLTVVMGFLAGAAVVTALIALLLRRDVPALAFAAALAGGLYLLNGALAPLAELTRAATGLLHAAGQQQAVYVPVAKAVGIAAVVRIAGAVCRDAGQSALAASLELAGAAAAGTAAAGMPCDRRPDFYRYVGGIVRRVPRRAA